SALSIPPWTDQLQQMLGMYWAPIVNCEGDRALFIRQLLPVLGHLPLTPDQVAKLVETRVRMLQRVGADNLRWDEYLQLCVSESTRPEPALEFEVRPSGPPQALESFFASITRVVRLREIRALNGFTRINPPSGTMRDDEVEVAPIKVRPV